MTSPLAVRTLLALALLVPSAVAAASPEPDVPPAVVAWLSDLVTRVGDADRKAAAGPRRKGTVVVHVRVSAEGRVEGVEVDAGRGGKALAGRAREAVVAVGRLAPPPAELVSEDGYTELSFPLDLEGGSRRPSR